MSAHPQLWVEQSGQGPPLLCISGLGYASWCWAELRERFGGSHRVITFDNRGTGRSDKPPAPYSIAMLADDAARVLDQCGVAAAHVVGHSMGGYIALTLALRHPARVRSLVLVGTGPGGAEAVGIPEETQNAWQTASQLPPAEYARMTMPRSFAPGWAERNPQRFEELLKARLRFPTPGANWRAQFDACVEYFTQGVDVSGIDKPALVIHGREDRVVPHANGELLARNLPRARLESLDGVGHLPYFEAAEKFYNLLREFLELQK